MQKKMKWLCALCLAMIMSLTVITPLAAAQTLQDGTYACDWREMTKLNKKNGQIIAETSGNFALQAMNGNYAPTDFSKMQVDKAEGFSVGRYNVNGVLVRKITFKRLKKLVNLAKLGEAEGTPSSASINFIISGGKIAEIRWLTP